MTAKNPIARREKLLKEAAHLIVSQGVNALTLDAVAAAAGVSKGGLLHHFPTKDALIHGMLDLLIAMYVDRQNLLLTREAPGVPGRWLRAYIDMTFVDEEEDPGYGIFDNAITLLVLLDPSLRPVLQDKLKYLGEGAAQDGLPLGEANMIRLACDGYWLGQMFGMSDLDNASRLLLRATLHALTLK